MGRTFRILALALPLGTLAVGLLWLHYRPEQPRWKDHITVSWFLTKADVEGSWALTGWHGYMGTALQLHDGEYRYWFYSDVSGGKERQYPVQGRYYIRFNRLVLDPDPWPELNKRTLVHGIFSGLEGLWFDSSLKTIVNRAESPKTRMLQRVSRDVDPIHPIYNFPVRERRSSSD